MNQNLPERMLEGLGRQPLPADHPSADVLTAFAENALVGDEYRRTADHLSRCGECREIVFLASSAAAKPLPVEEQVAAGYAAPRRRMPRVVWGMSIAAAVLVAASALVWWRKESAAPRIEMASRTVSTPTAQPMQQDATPAIESKSSAELKPPTETPSSIGSKPATALQTTVEVATPPAWVAKSEAKTPRAKNVSPKGAETPGMGASAGIVVGGAIPAPAKAEPTPAARKPAPIAISGAPQNIGTASTTAPAIPHVNSFAAPRGGPLAAAPESADQLLPNPQTTIRSVRATDPQWRITADGHLEHSTAEGWSRVLADRTATFRVVSFVGNHVWAGGSGGALFHSRDDGQNWDEVALTTPNGRETATIVSIQFDDAQRGTVTTNTGTRCNTTDGGAIWNCQ
jgi:hypothetical protein